MKCAISSRGRRRLLFTRDCQSQTRLGNLVIPKFKHLPVKLDSHLKSMNSITVMKQLETERVTAVEAPPDRFTYKLC